ncbi:MAG: glycosyltransferase [Actinomycetota bacterium]|nr:glycosyltransferase [Actinomycetota bacterium]
MITSLLALACVSLAAAFLGLLALGGRWRIARLDSALLYSIIVAIPAYVLGEYVWQLPDMNLWVGIGLIVASCVVTALIRPDWNPAGQAFLGTLALTSLPFLALGGGLAFIPGRAFILRVGDLGFVALQAFALVLLVMGTHETLDATSRVRWRRRTTGRHVPGYTPFISVHVATHNEPPELVIETLKSLKELDYPAHEVIVLDNNTTDPELWQPVDTFCREEGLKFVHLENWPGYKSGALNYGLEILDPRTEIIAIVDADFIVDRDWLQQTSGYFADPKTAIVQTAQGFRSEIDTGFFHRLGLTYRTFDAIGLPSRNERNAIIFAGTMGLIRRSALLEAGGWGEWCVTEDAELSLRILARGYTATFVERIFGYGVMPLTFAALKSQRFRWCFGGIQLLRKHWRLLMTGRGVDDDGTELELTRAQRYDYLAGGLQWFGAPLTAVFGVLLVAGIAARFLGFDATLRPLTGFFVAVPALLLVTGVIRAVWALRLRLNATAGDAFGVFLIFLSMTWAVTLACFKGLIQMQGAFLRTPKFKENQSLVQTLKATRAETPFAVLLTAAGALAATSVGGGEGAFLAVLAGWSALVFWSAPAAAFAASRTRIRSGALRHRRDLESERQRKPVYLRPSSYALAGASALLLLLVLGGSVAVTPERAQGDIGSMFALPRESAEDTEDGRAPAVVDKPERPGVVTPAAGRRGDVRRAADSGRATRNGSSTRTGTGGNTNARPGGATGQATPAAQPTAAAPVPQASPAAQPTAQPTSQPAPAASPAPQASPAAQPSPAPRPTSTPQARPTDRPGGGG